MSGSARPARLAWSRDSRENHGMDTGPARTWAPTRIAGLCGLVAIGCALGTTVLGAAARPGYSHVAQFISELGEAGAPHGLPISLFGFGPTGLATLAFLALAAPAFPGDRKATAGLWAFGAVGVAYLVAAIARCDPGCPAAGSATQTVHNVFGVLEYVGACSGLVLLSSACRADPRWRPLAPLALACAVIVGVGFAGVLLPGLAGIRGLSQRVAEIGIFLWIGMVSVAFLRRRRGSVGPSAAD